MTSHREDIVDSVLYVVDRGCMSFVYALISMRVMLRMVCMEERLCVLRLRRLCFCKAGRGRLSFET